jgi:hypothetical protein
MSTRRAATIPTRPLGQPVWRHHHRRPGIARAERGQRLGGDPLLLGPPIRVGPLERVGGCLAAAAVLGEQQGQRRLGVAQPTRAR